MQKGYIDDHPFKEYKFQFKKTQREFLTIAELKRFSEITCILEVCKFTKDEKTKVELNSNELNEIYLDELGKGLFSHMMNRSITIYID